MLILIGMVGLAACHVPETLKTSLSTAFIMSGGLTPGVILSLCGGWNVSLHMAASARPSISLGYSPMYNKAESRTDFKWSLGALEVNCACLRIADLAWAGQTTMSCALGKTRKPRTL